MIYVDNVSKVYGKDFQVLENINLTITQGEFVSIVGHSGAGKTTLLKLLLAEEAPTSGNVYFESFNIHKLRDKDLTEYRRKVGVVFQDFRLLPDRTVKENMLFVLKATGWTDLNDMNNKIEEVLTKVGMQDFGNKMPHQLSGGEQQRVAVARALINQPAIVFADEPTGNLDSKNAKELHQLFTTLRNELNQTFLIVTHNEELAGMSDRVLHMKDGLIITPQQI